MSQRAGHESVSFLTAVLYPDHWPAFQCCREMDVFYFQRFPSIGPRCRAAQCTFAGGQSERAQARKSSSVLTVNNTYVTQHPWERDAHQKSVFEKHDTVFALGVKYIEMVILSHICVKWLQWFRKVAVTVPRLIIHKGPVLCKVDFICVFQEKYIPVSELPRNGRNPSLTEFAGTCQNTQLMSLR